MKTGVTVKSHPRFSFNHVLEIKYCKLGTAIELVIGVRAFHIVATVVQQAGLTVAFCYKAAAINSVRN